MPTPAIWVLEVDGVGKTFAAWNAKNPQVVYRSFDDDEASFVVYGDPFTDCPIVADKSVRLSRNGVWQFVGTVLTVKAAGTPKTAVWTVKCVGPWYKFRTTLYQQPLAVYTQDGCAQLSAMSTKVVLFQDEHTTGSVTTGVQIRNAVNYGITLGVAVSVGTVPELITVPFQPAHELTIADVIRISVQWSPDAVGWFTYTSGAAVFNAQARASLTPISKDFAADPSIITSFDLTRRDDLVPTGVLFNYLKVAVCPTGTPPAGCATRPSNTDKGQIVVIVPDTAGTPNLPGGLIATIDLQKISPSDTEPAPTGLAAEYYASLLTPQWEGSVSLREQECAGDVRVGNVLNLTNGNTAWATMNAVVQEVSESLTTGETTIRLGTQTFLGPQEFVTLLQQMRRRTLVQTALPVTRAPGTVATPNCNAGMDPEGLHAVNTATGNAADMSKGLNKGASGDQSNTCGQCFPGGINTKTLSVCEDGSPTNVGVYGPPD